MATLWHALERVKISIYGPTAQIPEGEPAASAEEEPAPPKEKPTCPEETPAAIPEETQAAIPEEEIPTPPGETPASTPEDMSAPSPEAQNSPPSHASEPLHQSRPATSFSPPLPLPVTRYIRTLPIPHLPGQMQYIDTVEIPFADGHVSTWESKSVGPAPRPPSHATRGGSNSSKPHTTSGHTLRTHADHRADVLSSSNIQSPLLRLAPELRNKIYRYALVDPDYITIPSESLGPPPPESGLLSTCRQIRSEAKAIYYLENRFHFEMPDYDASAYIKWCQRSKLHYKVKMAYFPPLSVPANNRSVWENVMIWLQARYEKRVRKSPGPRQDTDTSPEKLVGQVVVQFQELRDRGIPWSTIREDFERSRRMVALFDRAWHWEE